MALPASLLAVIVAVAGLQDDAFSPPRPAPSEWESLDRRLDLLAGELGQTTPPLRAWIQSSWRGSSSDAVAAPSGERASGVGLDTARLVLEARRGDFGCFVELELAPGPVAPSGAPPTGLGVVLDAYATWWLLPDVSWSLGNMRRPFLRSAELPRDGMLFLDRSALGELTARREPGVRFAGELETLRWRAAVQNGADDAGERNLYSLRIEVLPTAARVPPWEGARGAPEDTAIALGVAVAYEDGVDHGMHTAVDLVLARAPFALALEGARFDDGPFPLRNPLLAPVGAARSVDGTSPWAATASVLLLDIHELAVRWQESDDAADTRSLTAAFIRHLAGPAARWVAQWEHVFTLDPAGDFDRFSVGLLVSL